MKIEYDVTSSQFVTCFAPNNTHTPHIRPRLLDISKKSGELVPIVSYFLGKTSKNLKKLCVQF